MIMVSMDCRGLAIRLRALPLDAGERRAVDFFACGRLCVGFLAVVLARAGALPLFDADGLLREEVFRAAAPLDLRAVVLRPRAAGALARALVAVFFFAAVFLFATPADFFALAPRFTAAPEERFFAGIIPPFLDCDGAV